MSRIFVSPDQWAPEMRLSGDLANYLLRVLRLRVGESLVVFDGVSREADATVVSVSARSCALWLGEIRTAIEHNPLNLTTIHGCLQGDKAAWLVEKLTEVGVARVVFFPSARSTRTSVRLDRLTRIAQSAARQSGRVSVPDVSQAASLNEAAADSSAALRLFGDTAQSACPIADVLSSHEWPTPGSTAFSAAIVVGAEGGLGLDEIALLKQRGFQPMRLGPRTFRAETAGIVIASILMHRLGDLG